MAKARLGPALLGTHRGERCGKRGRENDPVSVPTLHPEFVLAVEGERPGMARNDDHSAVSAANGPV